MNFWRYSVPAGLAQLTQQDLDQILRARTPLTESYAPVYSYVMPARVGTPSRSHMHAWVPSLSLARSHLAHSTLVAPSRRACAQVKANLYKWQLMYGAQIMHVAQLNGCEPSKLTPAQVARGVLARPDIDPGGKSYIEIGMPVLECNTNAYKHVFKFTDAIRQHIQEYIQKQKSNSQTDGLQPEPAVEDTIAMFIGDGQTLNILEGAKKHWDDFFWNTIPLKGAFHSESHFNFGAFETFAHCLCIWAANILDREIDESKSCAACVAWRAWHSVACVAHACA